MDDLNLIKKHYGEKMMHLCRELFPTLIEKKDLFKVISSKFDYSKFLYDDIIEECKINDFKNLIYSQTNLENSTVLTNKTPSELLSDVGYILYECNRKEDILKFKKYYAKGEELCTFDSDRLRSNYVFFAVKKNVDKIKRENFINPKRQDEYGTSVISIQFSKGKSNTLSIKNRYNHTVNNPDATYSNNLDNIISGLTYSFEKEYGLNITSKSNNSFELDKYVLANDGKYYKYNLENFNIYYCINNTIIDNFEVKKYEKEKYIVFDYFILDLVNKKLIQYDEGFFDTFIDSIGKINDIEIKLSEDKKYKNIIINKNIIITLNKQNTMVKYKNQVVKEIDRCFLSKNINLEEINLKKVEIINDNFLSNNTDLKRLILPNVISIAPYFLQKNIGLRKIDLPKLKKIYGYFLTSNEVIKEVNLPNLEYIGPYFLINSSKLKSIYLPKTKIIQENFMSYCKELKKIDIPNLKKISYNFLNDSLASISIHKGKIKDTDFEMNISKLKEEFYDFLPKNIKSLVKKIKH